MSALRTPPERFHRMCEDYGIAFEPGDVARLGAYLAALLEGNERINLTTVTDPEWAWVRHIFDSLTLMPFLTAAEADAEGPLCIIDIGTGGGLPGMPLAIAMPRARFTLLEATGKKADFLRETIDQLGLTNVDIVNERAETAGHDPSHREQYDGAVARAVGRLAVLLEYTSPFIKVGRHVLAIKGEQAPQDITEARQALHHLHCRVLDTHRTPTGTIVVVEKARKTPKIYPRRPGEPKRRPLG